MAALMANYKSHDWKVLVAEPGSGKSFVIALLANYLHEKGATDVFILSHHPLLVAQIEKTLQPYKLSKFFKWIFQKEANFEAIDQICHNAPVIMDEGDLYLENEFISFDATKMGGLAARRKSRLFIFTATLSNYWEQVLRVAMKMTDKSIHRPPSLLALKGESSDSLMVKGQVFKDLDLA